MCSLSEVTVAGLLAYFPKLYVAPPALLERIPAEPVKADLKSFKVEANMLTSALPRDLRTQWQLAVSLYML